MELKYEKLPDSELAVMMVIWKWKESMGTGKIVECMEKEKGWTRSTTQVILSRLEEKRFLLCEKRGRLKFYKALVKEEEYRKKETKSFVENFYEDSYTNLVASLVQTKALTKDDINELIAMLEEK